MEQLTPNHKTRQVKDSGVEWLGEIPKTWGIKRLKYLVKIKTGEKDTVNKVENGKYPFFVRSQNPEKIDTYSYDEEAVLTAGDGYIGKIFHYVNGKFECHQRVYKFSSFKGLQGKYLYYYLHHHLGEEVIKLSAKSTVDSLRLPMLQNFPVLLPPRKEQERVVVFLDQKTAEIDAAITKKQSLIELLKEQKAILINQAVTRGLNPDVPMRDSGVEWIGGVPEHWEVKRAKYLFYEVDERSKTGTEELLSVSHMTGVTPRSEKNINMFMAEDYTGSKLCQQEDLVFNIMWAWMGALGVSDRTGIVSPSYGIYRQQVPGTFNAWYLEHLVRSGQYVAEYNRRSTGLHSSRLRLYSHMFFDMEIGFPPKEEQDRIEKAVAERTDHIDNALQAVNVEIDKLNEFRNVIISEAVTGKIKL